MVYESAGPADDEATICGIKGPMGSVKIHFVATGHDRSNRARIDRGFAPLKGDA